MIENKKKFDGRGKSKNPNKLRNLPQYRDLDDDEFLKAIQVIEERDIGLGSSKIFERRIEEKLDKFEEDYDLSDLKINDKEILRGLVQAILSLEDYEQELYKIRETGITPDNLLIIDKLQKAMSDLRKDISNFQNDLAITRKHRRSDQETSVIAYIDSLKEKARKFLESRQAYILCPKCSTLLMTCWTLYPENPNNKIHLTCLQKDKDGVPCGTKFSVTTKELLKNKQSNRPEVLPQSMT